MHLGFGYLYKFMLYFFLFLKKKAENRFKKSQFKASWPKFCNIIFLFFLKIG